MENETTFEWNELTEGQQQTVVIVHANASFRFNKDQLKKIFDVARPKIVFGEGFKYCRIHADSADVVKLLIREYA